MQTSRFELKYVISEQQARCIRDYIRSFLALDKNCVGKSDFSYAVHSPYVDSDHLQTYWDTLNGNRNRFKLRLRFYSDAPDSPVFLEIKRRLNNCIKKQRAAVRREAVPTILTGQLPQARALAAPDSRQLVALQEFCRLVQKMKAKPKVHVAYLREAYLPLQENSARVTMDRLLRTEFNPTVELSTQMRSPLVVWGQTVVLELKFSNRFPNWFRDLVRTFDLRPCGAAKYADGLSLLQGRQPQYRHMHQPNLGLRWPVWRTPQPQRFGASGKVAAADGVARVNEEGALARAANLGSLPPGASV
jgi:hypothetical protein